MKSPILRRRAFTLLELLITMGVIAVLAALAFPIIRSMQSAGKSAACQGNLRQIAAAFSLYRAENQGALPKSADQSSGTYFTWFHILLGQGPSAKWDPVDRSFVDGSGGPNLLGSRSILNCPEGSFGTMGLKPRYPIGYGMTSLTLWNPPPTHKTDTVATNFFAHRLLRPAEWPLVMCADHQGVWELNNPIATAPKTERFAARHNGFANILMVDGHVERAKYGDKRWTQSRINKEGFYSN